VDKIIITAYGLLMILGAFLGFKAGSKVSLIMGLVSGILVFGGLAIMRSNARMGLLFLSIIGGVLSVTFLMRFLKTQKVMPSGMLLTISILFLVFCVWRYLKSS